MKPLGTMDGMETAPLLSPRKTAQALGISAEEALTLMLSGQIRTVTDNAGVMMVPRDAIVEYREAHTK
jgi:predicted site-specific integrase-resolvase